MRRNDDEMFFFIGPVRSVASLSSRPDLLDLPLHPVSPREIALGGPSMEHLGCLHVHHDTLNLKPWLITAASGFFSFNPFKSWPHCPQPTSRMCLCTGDVCGETAGNPEPNSTRRSKKAREMPRGGLEPTPPGSEKKKHGVQ